MSKRKFFKDESGVTAIEYGLVVAAIFLALIVLLPALQDMLVSYSQN